VALSLTSIERENEVEDPDRWQRRLRYAVYGGVVPATVILVAAAGWYIATGETPGAVVKRLTTPPGFSMALPPDTKVAPPPAPAAARADKSTDKNSGPAKPAGAAPMATALMQPPIPAIGAMPPPLAPPAPPPTAGGAMPKSGPPPSAGGAMPKAAPPEAASPDTKAPAPSPDAKAKTAEEQIPPAVAPPAAETPATPAASAPPTPATTALTPMKPTPMNKVAELPPPPSANAPAPANPPAPAAAAQPQVATAAPAPPPVNEPLAPPSGEALAPPSFAQLPARTDLKPLDAGPQADLVKDSPDGPLPVADGSKEPRTAYARAFVPPKEKAVKIAVVVVGLGLSREAAEAAIAKLPPEVDLSFSPYAGNLDALVKKAREAGHEVLLDLPLEPPNFPLHDAGPLAIMAQDSPGATTDRLRQILGKTTSYVGLAAALHSPVATGGAWPPLLHEVRERGLLLVGDGFAGIGVADAPALATVALVPDETPFRAAIDASLDRLLATAQRDGSAVAYVSPRPVTFERLVAWTATLPQRGAVLAPVSALVQAPQS
jgi:polysaccharide deacetylase 2 family uncharacterized protein YibQ